MKGSNKVIVFLLMSYLHVFVPPDNPDMTYIKRVIGLPGETIEVRDGKVYANSVGLDNSFLNMPKIIFYGFRK